MKLQWHVVYTYPHREKMIFEKLVEQQIDAFLPMQSVTRKWSDRKKTLQVPLFPNYVFVNVISVDRYKVFVSGVSRMISFDGKPAIIANEEINTIKLLMEGNWQIKKESYYTIGDKVRVTSGPLKGHEGILVDQKGSKRFGIRFNSFEQAISIDVQSRFLERI